MTATNVRGSVPTKSTKLCRAFGVMLLVLAICGCPAAPPAATGPAAKTHSARKRKKRRGVVLERLVSMAQPDVLGLETDRATVSNLLNDWVSLGEEDATRVESVDQIYQQQLSESVQQRMAEPRFSRRDVGHIRNAVWYKRVVAFVTGDSEDDLDRAVRLFEYVARNIVVKDNQGDGLPAGPFTFAMLGEGSSRDRAWLYANLLRELRIDSVILVCDESPESWLHGVLLDDKVYLFDHRLGLPVPADQAQPASAAIRRPATLDEVRDDPSLLTGLSSDEKHPYPVQAAALLQAEVRLVGTTALWSPRMRRLQMSLSGENGLLLWDPLESSADVEQGLVARVLAAGWERGRVRIWDYPENRLDGVDKRNIDQRRTFRRLSRSFEAPIPVLKIVQDPQTRQVKLLLGPPKFRHRKTRNRQLIGNLEPAVTAYLGIRLWKDVPPLPEKTPFVDREGHDFIRALLPNHVQRVHVEAADEASYWIGVCQVELQQLSLAAESLATYRSRGSTRAWNGAALVLEASCRARVGQIDKAITLLKQVKPRESHWSGCQVRIARWQSLRSRNTQPAPAAGGTEVKKGSP